MSASSTMTFLTGCGVAVVLILTVIAGRVGDLAMRDSFIHIAIALGIGGLLLVALFSILEVRGGIRAGRTRSVPERAVRVPSRSIARP